MLGEGPRRPWHHGSDLLSRYVLVSQANLQSEETAVDKFLFFCCSAEEEYEKYLLLFWWVLRRTRVQQRYACLPEVSLVLAELSA
jgi:hypothetical protein